MAKTNYPPSVWERWEEFPDFGTWFNWFWSQAQLEHLMWGDGHPCES